MFGKTLLVTLMMVVSSLSFASKRMDTLSGKSKKCMECHKKTSPALVEMWGASKHYGANVGCFECHTAEATDKDQFMHHGERISIIVSPKDCS